MNFLQWIGFYEDSLERAWEICENNLEKYNIENGADKLEELFKNTIHDYFEIDDATNSMIRCMFECTANILEEDNSDTTVDYDVNGYVSDMYVNCNTPFEIHL